MNAALLLLLALPLQSGGEQQPILLRAGAFDPLLEAAPSVPPDLAAAPDGGLVIVQWAGRPRPGWREGLESLGGERLRFLPENAGVWQVPRECLAAARSLPGMRWTGPMHPAWKLEPALLEQHRLGTLQTARYSLVTGRRDAEEKDRLARAIAALGGSVDLRNEGSLRMEATLAPAALLAVARRDEVLWVDRWGPPGTDMNNARIVMGADFLEAMAGFTGAGVRAEVFDQGLDTVHSDWLAPRAPVMHTANGTSDAHGTAVFGINFGAGASHPNARGLLPAAQGIFAAFGAVANRLLHTQELLQAPYFAVYQTSSWGGPRTSLYTSASLEMDDIAFQTDLALVQTQGNGPGTQSRPEAWARNVVSVGGNFHLDNADDADDYWGGGSSTGPASDGRIKPDLTAYYDAVWTSDAEPGGFVAGEHYSAFGGSSAATPMVAGHLGLIHQMWHAGIFGNPTGATVFDSRPHASLARALLIHSARQYPLTQADFTRFNQGWGKPDLEALYLARNRLFWVDQDEPVREGETRAWSLDVAPGAPELRATLVYPDPPGSLAAAVHRVNDLSLKLTAPDGKVYWGNYGLGSSNSSPPGGTPDDRNTVENVFVDAPLAGTWTVAVIGHEINQDAHAANGSSPMDAAFALAVSPVTPTCVTDTVELGGPASVPAGGTVTLQYANAPAGRPFWVLAAGQKTGTVIKGQCFDVGPRFLLVGSGTTHPTGNGTWTTNPVPAKAAGKRFHLEMAVRAAGGLVDSNPVTVDVL